MANNLVSNPIIIETKMTTSFKSQVASSLGTLFTLLVEKVVWINPMNSGDVALIIDPDNGFEKVRFIVNPAIANQTVVFPMIADWTAHPKLWKDFMVNQLDSGRLEIHCR